MGPRIKEYGRAVYICNVQGYKDHGVFTYVLLEGMRGKADRTGVGAGAIYIDELADFARAILPEITKEKWGFEQIPMRMIQGDPFPIACCKGFGKPGCKK